MADPYNAFMLDEFYAANGSADPAMGGGSSAAPPPAKSVAPLPASAEFAPAPDPAPPGSTPPPTSSA